MSVVDSVDVTFVYEKEDEIVLPVKVQLIGRVADYDRELTITATSENAEEGVDYELPESSCIKAGASSAEYEVVLKRTEELKTERKMLALEIHQNSFFTLPVTEIVQISDTVSTLNLRIYFSDMFTSAPKAWESDFVGSFSQQKFELICKVLDIDPDDFNDNTKITLAKLLYISTEMTRYVNDMTDRKASGLPYDEDAFSQTTGEPLVFTNIG